jgi:predicted lipid-binding transport protein (Tim44 family)
MEVRVMANEQQKPDRKGVSGLVFVGCLILGLAIGLLTGNVAVGLLGGLGVGFIAMAIVRYITGEW